MIKGLSIRAQKLLTIYAQNEGRKTGSEQLLPEHFLLALLKTAECTAYTVLQRLKINILTLQLALEQSLTLVPSSDTFADLPPSRRLRTLLDVAVIESRSMRSEYVGTEHLLLAAFREDASIFRRFLEKANISVEDMRRACIEVMPERPEDDTSPSTAGRSGSEGGHRDLAKPSSPAFPSAPAAPSKPANQRENQSAGLPLSSNSAQNGAFDAANRGSTASGSSTAAGGNTAGGRSSQSSASGPSGFPGQQPFFQSPQGQERDRQNASLLQEYSRDLTAQVRQGLIDPVVGRDREIMRVIQILSRRTKNNPVLIGEPGVGKTAIVEGLAARIACEDVPRNLIGKRLLTLDLASVIAGTKYRGEFEERIKRIMKEIREQRNIILFIDELHTIIGAGGAEGAMDASNMLKPALSRGELQCIGATTLKEYRKYFERDAALERRFQIVQVKEPDDEQTCAILEGIKSQYEKFHGVTYDQNVIPVIVRYSRRYITDRFLPDKAIDLLDEAGAMKKIMEDPRPAELDELEDRIALLVEEKQKLVQSQNYERAAEIRDEVRVLRQRFETAADFWQQNHSSGKTAVTVDDIAKVVSVMTGIPAEHLDTNEMQRLVHIEKELHKSVIGQDEAISLIASAIRRSRAGVSSFRRPLGSFIFLGPTGVGKTLLAKTLSRFLFGSEESLIRIDMSDYMEKHNSSRLVGAPPGYVGYEEGGVLTEKVRRNPYSVILLDEIEKAHPDVFNLLLQILEEGELHDSLGHVVNFRNTVIIMTSNAGARQITNDSRLGFSASSSPVISYSEIKSSATSELKKIMSPELLNRIDDIVVFSPLSNQEVSSILDLQTAELSARLAEQHVYLEIKPAARKYLIENGYDPAFGARPMRRLIQREIEQPLSVHIINGKCTAGCTAVAEIRSGAVHVRIVNPDDALQKNNHDEKKLSLFDITEEKIVK